MLRKAFLVGAAVPAVLILTVTSSTATPALVTINSPTSTTYTVTFPYTQAVSVTFAHGAATGEDLCDSAWSITVVGPAPATTVQGSWSGTFLESGSGNNKVCIEGDSEDVSRSVTIPSAGSYTVTATLNGGGSHVGTDTETPIYQEHQTQILVDYPAAPAVANDLLKSTSAKGKQHGKCIAAVADHMGTQTDFGGFPKSDVGDYRSAVDAFLALNCPGYTS
jgi:hypothetical protein